MTFSDLQPNQLCTFIHTLDATLGMEDVCIGVRSTDDCIRFIYSMGGFEIPGYYDLNSEALTRKCRFVSAGEVLHLDPLDYPEVCI